MRNKNVRGFWFLSPYLCPLTLFLRASKAECDATQLLVHGRTNSSNAPPMRERQRTSRNLHRSMKNTDSCWSRRATQPNVGAVPKSRAIPGRGVAGKRRQAAV